MHCFVQGAGTVSPSHFTGCPGALCPREKEKRKKERKREREKGIALRSQASILIFSLITALDQVGGVQKTSLTYFFIVQGT